MDRIVDQRTSYADSLTFEKIPSPVIQQAKRLMIDALGCAVGGADSQPSRIAGAVAMETTGPWRATVLATGQKALPGLAAFANGTMIRYLDYNDTCIKNLGIVLLRNGTRDEALRPARAYYRSRVGYPTEARLPRLDRCFELIEKWTMTLDKFEVMRRLNEHEVPCGPILDLRELAEERALRATGTVVEVDHPKRGKFLTVGNPIKLSDSPTELKRSPVLGEHTGEILRTILGLDDDAIEEARRDGAI